jgi:hypothetical protein
MPLTDTDGEVLGSLCAIDTSPRDWTEEELADLRDLAAACSAELRLRIVSRHAEQARLQARQAQHQADKLAQTARTTLARSQLLLRAAADFADTIGLLDVRSRVQDLVVGDLKPCYVGLVLLEDGVLRRVADQSGPVEVEREHETYGLGDGWPTARAARENAMVIVTDADFAAGDYSPDAARAFRALNLHTAVTTPLPGTHRLLGVLVLGWDTDYELSVVDRATITALAGYTARAVERALFVDDRVAVAQLLQQAMLTDLPTVEGLETAALYRPAAEQDMVGGDWYDAYPLPRSDHRRSTVAVTIGDITGHDMHAAALMGQTRNMLRQADLDHPGADPARVVNAFEHANNVLDIGVSGTLVHAHLRPDANGDWSFSWTNAGHPPPLVADPDGTTEQLTAHGVLLHPAVPVRPRTTHHHRLTPGTTVLLYTDGLVEEHGDIDIATHHVAALLSAGREQPLTELTNHIVDTVAGQTHRDDLAVLAIRVNRYQPARETGEYATPTR